MKLKPQESCCVEESALSDTMQLKNEAAPQSSENCNGIAANGISSNGFSSNSASSNGVQGSEMKENGHSHTARVATFAEMCVKSSAKCKTKMSESHSLNGSSANGNTDSTANRYGARPKTYKTESNYQNGSNVTNGSQESNINQNGVRRKTKKTESVSHNGSHTNKNLDYTPNQNLARQNGVEKLPSTSNGISHSTHVKSKKKNKGKLRVNHSSCSSAPTLNGCEDNTPLVGKDSIVGLSNGVAAFTITDTLPHNQTLHDLEEKDMDRNNNSNVQPDMCEQVRTITSKLDSSIVNGENSQTLSNPVFANDFVSENGEMNITKCDTAVEPKLAGADCITPESGRSSNSSEIADNPQIDNEADLIVSGGEEGATIENSASGYCDSVDSIDSGHGGSLTGFETQNSSMIYEFDIPADQCGLLIGRGGYFVNLIKDRSNADINIRCFPFDKDLKVVRISGEEHEIAGALRLIKNRFKKHTHLTFEPTKSTSGPIVCPPSLKLSLPEGVEFPVMLSATINACNFFVHLPTHPSYYALFPFTLSMTSMYNSFESPELTELNVGNIVAANIASSGWYRAEIVELYEDGNCNVKYLDYGGYQVISQSALRQINIEYMQMPFQAIECYLADVTIFEDIGFTEDAKRRFEEFAVGHNLSASVTGVAEDGIPTLHLYQVNGATKTFINQALVEESFLQWVAAPPEQ